MSKIGRGVYRDAGGIEHHAKLSPNPDASRLRLHEFEEPVLSGRNGGYAEGTKRPLSEHLEAKNNTPQRVRQACDRIKAAFDGCRSPVRSSGRPERQCRSARRASGPAAASRACETLEKRAFRRGRAQRGRRRADSNRRITNWKSVPHRAPRNSDFAGVVRYTACGTSTVGACWRVREVGDDVRGQPRRIEDSDNGEVRKPWQHRGSNRGRRKSGGSGPA